MPDLHCQVFIGGLPVADDVPKLKRCHIAIGTPGAFASITFVKCLRSDSCRLTLLIPYLLFEPC